MTRQQYLTSKGWRRIYASWWIAPGVIPLPIGVEMWGIDRAFGEQRIRDMMSQCGASRMEVEAMVQRAKANSAKRTRQ